jgi:RNA polymerase sigma-70 factor, ECF subfamily
MQPEPSDGDLVQRIVRGDDEALIALYQRHGRAVFSLSYYIIRDRALAEEITQDVFVAVWQKASQYNVARGRLDAWLLQIARNLAIDYLRYERRRNPNALALDDVEPQADASNGPVGEFQKRELAGLLNRLPPEQRQVIELSYFLGYTHSEIAARLKLPVGTIKSRILLGLRKLKEMLK